MLIDRPGGGSRVGTAELEGREPTAVATKPLLRPMPTCLGGSPEESNDTCHLGGKLGVVRQLEGRSNATRANPCILRWLTQAAFASPYWSGASFQRTGSGSVLEPPAR
jgi:hypothetical protein